MNRPYIGLPIWLSVVLLLVPLVGPTRLSIAQESTIASPVDRTQPPQSLDHEFGLADGAAANGNVLFIPDVRAKKLFAYRASNKDEPWKTVVEDMGGFSGTCFQLGELYIADNPGGRILKSNGYGKPQEWVTFDDGARPNDLVVDASGNAYVTLTKEGQIRRIDRHGAISVVAEGIQTPNGITVSPDGKTLYVSAYRPGKVLKANVTPEGLSELEEFATLEEGEKGALADGMGMDRAGNVYCTGYDSVWIWNSNGVLLDRLKTPERPINCTFGGQHGLDLYISTFGGVVRQRMQSYGVAPNPPSTGPSASPENRPSTEVPDSIIANFNQVYYQEQTRKLLCDTFVPNSDEAGLPAIVLVHGGGWLHGDKTKFRPLAIKLAQRGFVVMSIEYRLGHEAKFPAGIHDCNAAIRYLRSNAAAYNVDPDRISAVGGSAGGHLVGLMATGHNDTKLQPPGKVTLLDQAQPARSTQLHAAVVMAGPLQIASGSVAERSKSGQTSNATHWLGKTLDEAPDLYQLCDAYEKISADDPPLLFITGSEDNPQRDAPSLAKLKKLGVTARQIVHEGATHGHWNRQDWMDQVVEDIVQFLKSQG